MKLKSFVIVAVVGLISVAAEAQNVPYTFQSGTPAQAAQVNANFDNLNTRVNKSVGGIIQRIVSAYSDTGVASLSCPANSVVLSTNCGCDDVSGTRNYGVLFGCNVAGNGGVAGCFPEGTTFKPYLPNPRVTIKLVCLAALANDGSIITWTPIAAGGGDGGIQKTSQEQSDELATATKVMQDQVADHAAALAGRSQ